MTDLASRIRARAGLNQAPARSATLAARLGLTNVCIPEAEVISDAPRFGRPAVGPSKDLDRVANLPRRALDPADPRAAEKWTKILRKPIEPCDCREKWGTCIHDLLPIQGWGLEEASRAGGLLGLIGVGHGKTGLDILLPMVVPGCKVALLLIPPNLKPQFLQRDFPQWAQHWRVPNLAGGRFFVPGIPVLHVVAYSELSSASSTDLLDRIRPDLVIADEAHNLRRREAARTKRFLRHFTAAPETRLCALSGTLTTRSLKDYAHLSERALREGSPLPLHWPTVEEWAGAVDAEGPNSVASPIGALRRLCSVGEGAREGFRRRLVETSGVVATDQGALGTSLVISERKVKNVPPTVLEAIEGVREHWQRPDGEELTEAMQTAAVCRQLACGFFYRWIWPRGEPEELIREWLAARKEWHKELREKLKFSREHMDSPLLCTKAAIRWHEGFVHVDEDGTRQEFPPFTRHSLTWKAETWPRWKAVRDACKPETEAVWLSDYLVRDAVGWALDDAGILWYEHAAFGEACAKLSGLPLYGPGTEASTEILQEKGTRSIVASVKAHGTGKNLQMHHRNLIANPPADGGAWEQLLGRTHRQGQLADEVVAHVYRHTEELRSAFEAAVSRARYIEETTGSRQKLIYASRTF